MESAVVGMACPLCGSDQIVNVAHIGEVALFHCVNCGLDYQHPFPSPNRLASIFDALYTGKVLPNDLFAELRDYYRDFGANHGDNQVVRSYQRCLQELSWLAPGRRLLDVGCGSGFFLHLARQEGWEITGVDSSQEAVEYARAEFGLDILVGDIFEIELPHGHFGVITLWDVIEHVSDPVKLLSHLRLLLNPRGVLVVATPNMQSLVNRIGWILYRVTFGSWAFPLIKLYPITHLFYFDLVTLPKLLTAAGFTLHRLRMEETYLARLNLSIWLKSILMGVFVVARVLKMQNRFVAYAVKT